jgi:murein DD-endopeptidase MepM/ murein hydrolase activator NlpD
LKNLIEKKKWFYRVFESWCFIGLILMCSCSKTGRIEAKKEKFSDFNSKNLEVLTEERIRKNSNFAETLEKMKFSPSEIGNIVKVASPYLNFSKLRPNTKILKRSIPFPLKQFISMEVLLSWSERVLITRNKEGKWNAKRNDLPIYIKTRQFKGIVEASLWNSAVKAGLDPVVIEKLVQIFAWEIDFNREVLPVDSWRFTIEEKWAGKKRVSWGNILAAEYKNGRDIYEAVRFPAGIKGEYFDLNGKSLKKKFLKSPLRFGRITSRFARKRFHPILKIRRPHYGVDYAAPRGTPVFAVGSGYIKSIGYSRSSGKTIKIRHNSYYQTAYKHLHNFKSKIRKGRYVKQGEVIGYVGSTGLSTGPHLHFEFYERGRYVDPLGRKFPQLKKLKKENLNHFKKLSKIVWRSLPEREGPILIAKKDDIKTAIKDL